MLTSVEKYEILGEIGHGGMATVYRARDRHLQRLVALKVMHPHLQGAKEARARFAREALTVARLEHPGLLEIFDYSGEDSEISYIATELLEGPTLKAFMESHQDVPAEVAACIALQVAEALAAAHEAGVIHRDVKPENVMFHRGSVKLTDFGIAQLADVQGVTTTGQVLGSPGHMAPEQIEGKDCTPATDVFALGTVLYQLVTGRAPYSGRNPHQILKQIIEGRFQDPLQLRPEAGARMRAILLRCMAMDPAERYSSVAALAAELQAFVEQGGIEDPGQCLVEYLEAPAAFTEAFRSQIIERQTELGLAAQRRGRYPEALEHWNRVLAIDEGNARVLAAVRYQGRRARLRRLAFIAAGLVLAVAVVGVGAAWWQGREQAAPHTALQPLVVSAPRIAESSSASSKPAPGGFADGGLTPSVQAPVQENPTAQPGERGGGETVDSGVAQGPSAPGRRPGPGSQPTVTPRAAGTSKPSAGPTNPAGSTSGPRQVIFSPTPANVSIAVDDQPPRPFGPSFRQVELEPGEHRFRFIGAHECCIDEAFTWSVEPGEEPVVLARTLNFRPAGLYVVANAPANVVVDDGLVKGRARSIIDVPQRAALLQTHTIRVTAPGYAPEVRSVQLRAGGVRTVQIEMQSLGGKTP